MAESTLPGTTADLITFSGGRPVILHDGQPVPQSAYCDYIQRGDWEERIREFIDSGVKVFYLTPHGLESSAWWGSAEDAEKLKETTLRSVNQQAEYILSLQPDALFYIRLMSTVPEWWGVQYPEEMQTDEAGKMYWDASLPSSRYLHDVAVFVDRLVTHCEGQSWGERIVGYLEASSGEGCMQLTFSDKLFDVSPANESAFIQWIGERYTTDADLQQAWGDPTVTRAQVRVPRDSAWQAKRKAAMSTLGGQQAPPNNMPIDSMFTSFPGLFHWTEEENAAPEREYCRFIRAAFVHKFRWIARAIKARVAALGRKRLVGFDITKQPLLGWQIVLAFNGMGAGPDFVNILLLSGSWDVAELLDDEQIDVIFTPADYHARTVGFSFEAEGVSDSMLLRGKTMIIENDARSYIGQGATEQGAPRNIKEVEAVLLRNAAMTLSRGIQSYWCNVGSSYFHDAPIQHIIRKTAVLQDRLNTAPHRETQDAIAFIIDDESTLCEDFTSGYQSLSVVWQRIFGLSHCGLPYRIFLLSDMRKDTFPRYHTYFFPNLFKVDDAVLELLRARVLRDGNLAIFGPATGITDGHHLGAGGANALLGIPLELQFRNPMRNVIVHDVAGHPLTRELPASLTYGDSLTYGPLLVPAGECAVEQGGGVPLGHANICWALNRTGLFLKEFGRGTAGNGTDGGRDAGDYGVLWSIAMPLPASLLRAAARYAGSHIWCEEDDVIYASDSLVALHSVKSGLRTIKLPRACTVTDAISNTLVGQGMTEIPLTINAPETVIFTLE